MRCKATITRVRIDFINVALDKKIIWQIKATSEARKGAILSPELIFMYYCMYFYPNVYGLKLVKHTVFSLFGIECLHLSNATFMKTILHKFSIYND